MKFKMQCRYLLMLMLAMISVNVLADATPSHVYTENQQNITVSAKEPVFVLKLKSNPTTGYSWAVQDYNANYIKLVKHYYQPSKSMLMGAGGSEWWTFRVKNPGFAAKQPMMIRMIYVRPWEKNRAVKPLIFSVTTKNSG